MLFHTARFFVFLAIVLIVYYNLPVRARKVLLLLGSYYFYMCWNAKFILLILVLTTVDFWAAIAIEQTQERWKKTALIVSLVSNLGLLGFFKYYNFFASSLAQLLGLRSDALFLDIILPLGISFHTFQSMSYVIDVYRGQQKAVRDPLDYALFIAFFPQMVAGPIVRAREFFRDLYDWHSPTRAELRRGILLVILGLVKKVALADQAGLICDRYFANPAAHPGMMPAWIGAAAFTIQVYFDFSGYSDMAIGMAQLFGFHFPENFRRPLLSDCLTEYWHRWNMTLSRWLRDYVYISLGGSRRGAVLTFRNLMITMLLSGLWHGAAWHFVVWGGFVGVMLCLERILGIRPLSWREHPWLYSLRVPIAFAMFTLSMVLFRAADMKTAGMIFGQMLSGIAGAWTVNAWQIALLGCTLALAVLEEWIGWFNRLVTGPSWSPAFALAVMFFALELFSVPDAVPFIYFQF